MITAISLGVVLFFGIGAFLTYQMLYGSGTAHTISTFTLGCMFITVFYAIFHSLDWINDWMAGRQAQQFNKQAMEDQRNQYRVLSEQARAMSSMMGAFEKTRSSASPHIGFQDELFQDIDETPLPD